MLSIINADAGSPAAAAKQAICLPHHMLWKWVSTSTPNLDLHEVTLTPAQWSRLAVCIAQLPTDAVTSLQMSARSSMSHMTVGSWTKSSARDSEIWENSMSFEYMHMLGALEGAVLNMTHLQHLGLHNLYLTPHLIPALEQLFVSLPSSLTKLTLHTCGANGGNQFGEPHKLMFFRAVSRIESLQELHMSQWDVFVGSRDIGASAVRRVISRAACPSSLEPVCAEPLQSMSGLRVFVSNLQESVAFPLGLAFVPIAQVAK